MAPGAGTTVVFRSRSAQALGGAMVAVAAVSLLVLATEGSASVLRFSSVLLLFGLLGWAAFWRPCVEVSDGGVLVRNTWRSVHVPWPAVDSVEGRYGLRLLTAYGAVTAWGAPAPAGRSRRGEHGSSAAAALVRQRLQELVDAGHLEDRRLERPSLAVQWHRASLAVAVALLVAAAVLPLLA